MYLYRCSESQTTKKDTTIPLTLSITTQAASDVLVSRTQSGLPAGVADVVFPVEALSAKVLAVLGGDGGGEQG